MDASGNSLPRELRKFRILYDLAIAMTAEQSMEENLQLVVEKSRELLETETAYIALRDEARGDVYMHSLSGVRTEAFKKMRLPFGKGLGGLVAKTGQGFIVKDYLEETRITHIVDRIVAEEGVVSGVAVPVQIGKTNLGVLYAFNRAGTSFSQADVETLHLIGNLAAVEISRKRAEEAVRQDRIDLEQKVAARTSDLLKANRLLEQEIQQRKRAEEMIRESEERIRTIIEHSNELFYVHDLQHQFTYVSPQCKAMMGYTPDEIKGKWAELFTENPINRKGFDVTERALRTGRRQPAYVVECKRKDGHLILLEVDESPLRDSEGSVVGVVGAARDVTDRKRSEDALQAAERRYRSIFENAIEGMFQSTADGSFVAVNPALARMFGYDSTEELMAEHKNIRTPLYVNPARRDEFIEVLRQNGEIRNFEAEVRRKDGRTIMTCINARQVRDEKGNALFIDGCVEDITEQKRAEQAIRENEKKFLDLFDNVSDFIYFHDMDGNLVETNLAFRRAYGLEDKPSATINIRDLMPEETRPLFAQYLERVRAQGQDEGFMKVCNPHGREALVEYKNAVVHDSEGNVAGVRGSARDVTDRVRAEKEKKRLRAQIMSAQRIEAIGTLAGGIAHNFNNLLMGIQGNATLARLEVDPSSPVSRKLESIEKLVKSGAKLTGQLLGYARGGRYEVRPVSLNDLVKDISSTFAQARKDITVQLDLSESLKCIEVDQGQVEQAILNLLVNAADAMPSGGKVILRTRNVTHEAMNGKPYKPKMGKYVLLEVQDFGIGMDKKTMERIFEPFFTTKGMGKGTGLGLASAYGIVKGHGGYIDVASLEQKGSTFQIYLPASEKTIVKEKELPKGVVMGSGTILLIDDEQMVLEVGRGMLETLGYTVLASGDGREAIEIYAGNYEKIDLVVLDLVMPGMGGRETFEQLKSINPRVRVLLSSGFSIDTVAKEMLDHGCDGFIQKPFFIGEFSQEVAKILSRR